MTINELVERTNAPTVVPPPNDLDELVARVAAAGGRLHCGSKYGAHWAEVRHPRRSVLRASLDADVATEAACSEWLAVQS